MLGNSGGYIAAAPLSRVVGYRHRRFGVELRCEQGTLHRVSLEASSDPSTS